MSDGQENIGLDEQQAGRVEEYKFEPIKGYPMLNWRGKRPFTSTQFYPAQLKEVHGEEVDGWRNKIFWGDNLQVMSHLLKTFRGAIDLIYIDPPFDSKADYKKTISIRNKSTNLDYNSFEEKQYSDIWNNDDYLQFMYERLILCRELLSETGSLILHCDFHKSHHLRCLADEIFGIGLENDRPGFRSEIAWCYGGGGAPKTNYPGKHDTLLWYSKTSKWTFNKQFRPYSEGTKSRGLTAVKGDDYKLSDEGAMLNSWWAEAEVQKILSPTAYENLKYPTQKPEGLLSRIILGHSNEGDLVFDGFMGSGTTQACALKLGRRFLGADINTGAILTAEKRLLDLLQSSYSKRPGLEVYNVNRYDLFRNQEDAKDLLIEALEIQPIDQSSFYDGEKDGRLVKVMPVNRIATKADLNQIISSFDQKVFQRRQDDSPIKPVEKLLLICMGHEPDLKAELELQAKPFKVDVEVVDILRDKSHLEFKRDSQAKLLINDGSLIIDKFYPMNLLQKLSLEEQSIGKWQDLAESVMIDWNYDGAIFQPTVVDIPARRETVVGQYKVPADAGTIRVKITDLLSESWEGEIDG